MNADGRRQEPKSILPQINADRTKCKSNHDPRITEFKMEVTRTLARFIVNHRYADIPQKVQHEAARSFLNWVGCAVGASRHETVENALAALSEFSGPREATVLGRGDRLDIMLAALMNGTTSHTFDFDDTHLKTVIHPSGPVASAILALAERKPVKGEDFLHAFILGVEA